MLKSCGPRVPPDELALAEAPRRDRPPGLGASRSVPLDSSNHLLPEHDPAWPRFLAELDRFLPSPQGDRSVMPPK